MSPLTSVNAFLQSAMPAPVRSRRSLIELAVTSIVLLRVRRSRRLGVVHRAAGRHLDARAIAARRHVNDALALILALRATVTRGLFPDLGADHGGVRDPRREQLARANRIVV